MRRMMGQLMNAQPKGAGYDQVEATQALIERMASTKSNAEFLELLQKGSM